MQDEIKNLLDVEKFYDANRLKLNRDKTTVMLIGNENKNKKLTLNLGGDIIKNDLSIKILGWWCTPDASMNHHIAKIKGPVCDKLSKLKPYIKYMI